METVQISVGTTLLRQLIEAQPDVKLKLESMAAEKIAEEITRKMKNVSIEEIEKRANREVSIAFNVAISAFSNKWKFPQEAKTEIQDLARQYSEGYARSVEVELSGKVARAIEYKAEEAKTKILTELRSLIRETARTEFIAVLEKVQGKSE